MAYTETTTTTYGQRVKKSFGGIGSGILLFIVGTILLWWNEGRAVKTTKMLNEAAGVTVEMTDIGTIDPQFDGKLVHATGMTATIDSLIDSDFGVGVTAVKFNRKVEYYQWVENSKSQTKDKIGGGQETVTTYTYEKKWVNSPVASENFHDPEYQGANRIRIAIDDLRQTAENVSFGAYRLTKSQISSISGDQPYVFSEKDSERISNELFKEECQVDTTLTVKVQNNVISFGSNSGTPQVGDVRVTFTKVLPGEVSLMAQVSGDTFVPFTAKNGKSFSVLEMGVKSADQMYEGQHSANKIWLWILRILGIFLVIGGLKGIFGFIETLAKVVPFIANIIGAGVGLVCSLVGFAWSFIVIAIAWLTCSGNIPDRDRRSAGHLPCARKEKGADSVKGLVGLLTCNDNYQIA